GSGEVGFFGYVLAYTNTSHFWKRLSTVTSNSYLNTSVAEQEPREETNGNTKHVHPGHAGQIPGLPVAPTRDVSWMHASRPTIAAGFTAREGRPNCGPV